jgi:hypothetical protein
MANHGPVGQPRNGILIFVVFLCLSWIGWLIGTFVWMKKTLEEVAAFTGKTDMLKPILFFIPILNAYMLYQYATALKETQQKIGMPAADQINPILCCILMIVYFIGIIPFQSNVNKTWEFAGKK